MSENHVRNENALVLVLFAHIDPCTFGDSKYVWRILISTFVTILLYNSI